MRQTEPTCDFCGKRKSSVRRIIEGPSAGICDECVGLCAEMIAEDAVDPSTHARADRSLPSPRELVRHLDEYVVGQDAAKRTLAVAVYSHFKRIEMHCRSAGHENPVEIAKSNVLVLGPTGCGKTHIAQTMARKLDVPFAVVDATGLTEAGYVGDDVDSILLRLLAAADHDVDRAQSGIIYIDEVDKIGRREGGGAQSRDVSGEGVQQALLKILEGSIVSVSQGGGRSRSKHDSVMIDTKNILFIAAGAFTGLAELVSARTARHGVGFGAPLRSRAQIGDDLRGVRPTDLNQFGLIPEFVGRFPVVTSVEKLDERTLVRILSEPRNSLLRQYQALFASDGVELIFEQEALELVAEEAATRETGARGLRAIMEAVLEPMMFELPELAPEGSAVVTAETVRARLDLEPVGLEQMLRTGSA